MCQILSKMLSSASIMVSPPDLISSAGMLSTPALYFFPRNGIIVGVGHWWMFQYFGVAFSFVSIRFRTVFCPSLKYILIFREARPTFILHGIGSSCFELVRSFTSSSMISCCCSSQGCPLFFAP